MIKLTMPNGHEIEINADHIDEIYANDGTFKGESVIVLNGQHQAVNETVPEIEAKMREVAK